MPGNTTINSSDPTPTSMTMPVSPDTPVSSCAYVDLQVNGYFSVDFNQDDLGADDLHRACQRLQHDGVASILATIITDDLDRMCNRLRRLRNLRSQDPLATRMIAGFHIEGPFISALDGYRGAHPLDAVRPADARSMQRLLDAAGGLTRIITLAPETDGALDVIRMLSKQGIVVSAGHCDPSVDQLRAAIDAGLSMFTHLGNGCPMQMHRHDNIVQRALSLADQLWLCFIADGVHIPFVALSNYIRTAGVERCIVVTDAMPAAGLGPGRYRIARWDVEVGEDLAAWGPGRSHLIGSAMSMPQAMDNLINILGLDPGCAHDLVCKNPARAFALQS